MKLTRWVFVFCSLLLPFLEGCGSSTKRKRPTIQVSQTQNATPGDLPALRESVKKIFAEECAACHANGVSAGNFGYVDDLDRMLTSEAKFAVAGKPEESKIYQRMTSTNPSMSMPPKGLLRPQEIETVRLWLSAEGQSLEMAREPIAMASVFQLIREDFDRQQDRMNTRYLHFVNRWNAGVSKETIQEEAEALSKLLNMLSTRKEITKPLALDGRGLIYRVHLPDYDLHMPHGLAAPNRPLERIGRWKEVFEGRRPARDTAEQDAYFSALHTIRPPEYIYDNKGPCVANDTRVYLCDSNLAWMRSVMILNNPTEADGDPVLAEYVLLKGTPVANRTKPVLLREVEDSVILQNIDAAENGTIQIAKQDKNLAVTFKTITPAEPAVQKLNPALPHNTLTNPLQYSTEHNPIPLMRADWFIAQVSSNYQKRIYYHLAGIPDDTAVLDIALGIDDEGALLRDNEPDLTGKSLKPIIMRAGFTNSGVSQNHRILERIETQQFSDKALWRSYEFDPVTPTAPGKYNDILNYPFGPVLFPADPGVLGYECVNMFSSPNQLFKSDIDFSPIGDWASRYWTQTPINLRQFRPTRITNKADYLKLNSGDQATYQSYWGPQTALATDPMNNVPSVPAGIPANQVSDCEGTKNGVNIREADKVFNFHGFEYQFMRPNGLQGFATVAGNAFIMDTKIPNQVALNNPQAVLARDEETQAQIVIQPLSCLSCHSRGLIPKDDKIREYVTQNAGTNKMFSMPQLEKVKRIYPEIPAFRERLQKDNETITKAIESTGAKVIDQEPIVQAYKAFVARVTIEVAAAEVGVSPATFLELLDNAAASPVEAQKRLAVEFSPLRTSGGEVQRSTLETHLPRLIQIARSLSRL